MESRIFSIFLVLTLMSGAAIAADDAPVIDPNIDRREISESRINVDDFEFGVFAGVLNIEDFGSNSLTGLDFTYHINENFFSKISYGQSEGSDTSFERLSGGAELLTDEQREYSFYNLSIGYNLKGETFITQNLVFNSSTYVQLGAGSTEFGGDDRFTLSLGAGYRILLSDNFTVHIDMTDHIFDNDILGEELTTHNLAFSLGLSAFF